MNRRSFVLKTGILAVGSAVCNSLMGCSAQYETELPCLGVVPPPASVPGMTYIQASQIGCALDCNLVNGRNKYTGGLATDDAPRINAAMAGASASNPITLIIDGSALISGLFLPAEGYWSIAGLGCGTGFFIKSGTNNDGIHNGGPTAAIPSDPGRPAPARGSSVSLSNFTINGNHDGDSTGASKQGIDGKVWYFSINLMNLDNIVVENVVVVNSPAYQMRFSNVGNVSVSGCVLRSTGLSTDGLHFDGPANDITISNCNISTGDDAIALNCPEGYSGNISRVTVTNCTFNSWSLMRLDTIQTSGNSNRFNIDTVSVSNCSGTLTMAGFLLGQGAGAYPESITGLTISNCQLTAPAVLEIGANFGTVTLNNVTLTPGGSHQAPGFAFARTSPYFYGCTYVGTSLSINNCAIVRNSGVSVSALILEYNSSISNLAFNGFSVKDGHSPVADLVDIALGSIGQLVINSVDSTKIKAPVSPNGFASIASVSGSGVLATGWPFPDAVMANGVPYISATTNSPSVKVGGEVGPYDP